MNSRLKHILDNSKSLQLENRPKGLDAVIRDDRCPIYAYLVSLNSDASKKTVLRVLQSIAKHLNQQSYYDIVWSKFDRNILNNLIQLLHTQNKAPDTINLYVSVVKRVLYEAYLLDLVDTKRWERIKSVRTPKGGRRKTHKVLNQSTFEMLVKKIINDSPNPVMASRDIAIFNLFVGCGLRRFELINLQLKHVDRFRRTITFEGKGRKLRQVKMHPITTLALENWLKLRGNKEGPIFTRVYKSGVLPAWLGCNDREIKKLSTESIYMLCKKVGLLDLDISPHSLRRSYATMLDKNGADIKHIARLLGHSSIKTTELYIQTEQEEINNTVDTKLFI